MNPMLTLSGTRLAELIRKKEITSQEAVEAHIGQIEKVNPVIKAVVARRFEEARWEARCADERICSTAAEELPPFHGVPCTLKESFSLAGMPNSSGLVARRNIRADADATAVARLRAAGAIPLGVTNVSELCMWLESDNRVYGRTNNPYDSRRIVGGSSGGEGAIIAAGGSPFGLGSDVGGSIRLPAFFNGVFGHKPTSRRVPNTGQFPCAHGEGLRYLTTGPIARRAEDLMPLLRLLSGPDGQDSQCRPMALGDESAVDISSLTVLDVPDNGSVMVSKELRRAQSSAGQALAYMGAKVKKTRIKGLKDGLYIWSAMMSAAGGPSYASYMGNGPEVNPFLELGKWLLRRSPHTLPSIGLATLELIPKVIPLKTDSYVQAGHRLQKEIAGLLGSRGVMLYPTYSCVAPYHHLPLFKTFHWVYTAVFNALELPVTQVPLGLNRKGLPLGVQVVGAPGQDHVTIAVALALEKVFGGWVPPWRSRHGRPPSGR